MVFTFSGILLQYTNYQREVRYERDMTVNDALQQLVTDYPGLRRVLLDGNQELRRSHRLALNSEQLCDVDLARPLGREDEICILTAIAGG
jgi:molybdopterin converting factor small subunit